MFLTKPKPQKSYQVVGWRLDSKVAGFFDSCLYISVAKQTGSLHGKIVANWVDFILIITVNIVIYNVKIAWCLSQSLSDVCQL